MKRARGNSVVYVKTQPAKYARGTKGNPIVISQSRIPRALPMRAAYRKPELKGMDTVVNPTTIAATTNTNADIFPLNLVQQGSGSWNRVGRTIRIKSVRIKGTLRTIISTPPGDGAGEAGQLVSQTARLIVVWDKQPSGTLPTFNTIFGYTEQDGTESVNILSALRFDNTGRFSVIGDKVIDMNATAADSNSGTQPYIELSHSFDHFAKLGGRETFFSGQSSPMTIADISSGALYFIVRARWESTILSYEAGAVSYLDNTVARIRYTD